MHAIIWVSSGKCCFGQNRSNEQPDRSGLRIAGSTQVFKVLCRTKTAEDEMQADRNFAQKPVDSSFRMITSFFHAVYGNTRTLLVATALLSPTTNADVISITNHSFEDIGGESPVNEFTFGPLNGWDLYDPNNITNGGAGNTYFIGTLTPDAPTNFVNGATDGQRVGIAFNFAGSGGQGEYGMVQTLDDTLQANTRYSLSVDIGNIASGTARSGTFFDLDGFSGYRVDLLAGGEILERDGILAQDNNSLAGSIAEGFFETSTVEFTTGATHDQLGLALGIRLVNLNEIDLAFPDANLEVDFDNVRLSSFAAVPEPNMCLALLSLCCLAYRRVTHSRVTG